MTQSRFGCHNYPEFSRMRHSCPLASCDKHRNLLSCVWLKRKRLLSPGQLRGFAQAQLQPGESAEVRFPLRARDMSVWNATTHAWQLVHGSFGVAVGLSSRDAAALRGAFRSP